MTERRVVVGLRSYRGSRESSLRAAFHLIRADPQFRVTQRSLVWRCRDGAPGSDEGLSTGLCIRSSASSSAIDSTLRGFESLLRPLGEPTDRSYLNIDLLWIEGARPQAPEIASPELAQRPSSLTAMVELAEDALDPGMGKPYAAHLGEFPADAVYGPVPFSREATVTEEGESGQRIAKVVAGDDRELLAAIAEYGVGGRGDFPTATPVQRRPLECPLESLPINASAASRWLQFARDRVEAAGLSPCRVVIWKLGPRDVTGVALGVPRQAKVTPRSTMKVVAVNKSAAGWEATLTIPNA